MFTPETKKKKVWRVVMAHQAMFTNGRGHANEARCLQSGEYFAVGKADGPPLAGMNLQATLDEFNVHAYLAGHEHVNQFTRKSYRHGDCMHAVVGACVETHFYKGEIAPPERMVDVALRDTTGFATLTATATSLRIDFWDSASSPPQLVHSEQIAG